MSNPTEAGEPASAIAGVEAGQSGFCCAPLAESPLNIADAEDLAQAFKVLADPTRLRLLSLVASSATGEVCACDLNEPVGKSQPTVSHHLSQLVEAGLLLREKRGKWAWFAVVPERLVALGAVLATTEQPS